MPAIAACAPLLAEAMPHVAHPQIRNRGTLGGSLANADPAAELPVIMLALGARLKVCDASGERWVDGADFFRGMFTTDLAPDEMLVEIELPAHAASHGLVLPGGRAARRRLCTDGRGGAGHARRCGEMQGRRAWSISMPATDRWMRRRRPSCCRPGSSMHALIERRPRMLAAKEITPFGNLHATAEYQRHLARVLTRRALQPGRSNVRETEQPA